MKLDEHSKRLSNFATEVDQKYTLSEKDTSQKYKVSFRSRRAKDGKALSTVQLIKKSSDH
jgi:hypothetical protein